MNVKSAITGRQSMGLEGSTIDKSNSKNVLIAPALQERGLKGMASIKYDNPFEKSKEGR